MTASDKSHRDWQLVAKRVLKGEFKRATGSTVDALLIGLCHYQTDACVKAAEKLRPGSAKAAPVAVAAAVPERNYAAEPPTKEDLW